METSDVLWALAEDPDCPARVAAMLTDCAKDVERMERQVRDLAVATVCAPSVGHPGYAYIGPNRLGA
jgi:hypothetical protein